MPTPPPHASALLSAAHTVRHALAVAPAGLAALGRGRTRARAACPVDDGFAERLKLAMAEAGIGNPELARVAGVHRFTVTFWRSGKQRPHHLAVAVIARALGVRAAWLRRGELPVRPVARRSAAAEPVEERWIETELAAYAGAGVPAAERAAVAWLLRSPAVHPLYVGPRPANQPDAERLVALRIVSAHCRAMLRVRGYAIPADVGH